MLKISTFRRSSIVAGLGAAALLSGTLVNLPAASASSTYEAYLCDNYQSTTSITAQVQGLNQHGDYVDGPWEKVLRNKCTFVSNWWWEPGVAEWVTSHYNAGYCSGPSGGVLWCYIDTD
jgi:hypothetical protein